MSASYERQPGETQKAFEAFIKYRDLGPERSIRKVAQLLNKSYQLLARWSAQNDWVERVSDYDAEMDRLALVQEAKERKAMAKRHISGAMTLQEKALEALEEIEADELAPKDIIKIFVEAVKIERLSRGESTENAEVKHSGEVKERIEHDITERVERYADIYYKLSEGEEAEADSADEGEDAGDNP